MVDRGYAVRQLVLFSTVGLASVLLAGGFTFLLRLLGAAFVVLWMMWGIVLALGRGTGSESSHEKRQRTIIVVSGVLGFGAVILAPWEHMTFNGPFPRDGPLAWVGVVIFAAAVALQWWSLRELGAFYTAHLGIQERHRLVTTGPYSLVRHPGYLSGIAAFVGITLSMGSLLSSLATVTSLYVVIRRIEGEEEMLIEAFGDEYRAYQRRTRRLIPLIY
jgi:protein-S-isoprenylcysteine O-methyltransferase Ste14